MVFHVLEINQLYQFLSAITNVPFGLEHLDIKISARTGVQGQSQDADDLMKTFTQVEGKTVVYFVW